MESRVARSVGKVAEIPLQLKRAKESLSKLQNQLAIAKKSIEENGERKIQELSMQQSNVSAILQMLKYDGFPIFLLISFFTVS